MNNSNYRYELMVTIYREFDSEGNPVISSGEKYMLHTYESEMVTFDMSISEIQDISLRNSTHSKTIVLPDSDHNRKIFGYICNLNCDSNLFNPNKRTVCEILVDTLSIFVGTIQLKNILQDFKTNEVKYECVFFSSVIDFYKQIGDLYIGSGPNKALGLTGLNRFTHRYTSENIVHSWTQSVDNGYYYPLIDYGRKYEVSLTEKPVGFSIDNMSNGEFVEVQQMFPSVYLKVIIDEIFLQAGYQYDSNFFNSTLFSNLLIPFKNKYLKNNYDINALTTVDELITPGIILGDNIINIGGVGGPVSIANIQTIGTGFSSDNVNPPQSFQCKFTFINLDFTTQLVTVGLYTTYYENTTDHNLSYKPSVSLNIYNRTPFTKFFIDTYQPTLVWASLKDGETVATTIRMIPLKDIEQSEYDDFQYSTNGYKDGIVWGVGLPPYRTLNSLGLYTLEPGEKTFVYMQIYSIPPAPAFPVNGLPIFNITRFSIRNVISDYSIEGDYQSISDNLPANVKQKDLFSAIVKMFNLYIEPDKVNPTVLRIEPRDDYYRYDKDTGTVVVKNWTDKIDLDKPINMQILADTQDKTIKYTYKEDKDYFNTYYKMITGRVQGDAIKEIDNDFSSGEKKVEIMFGASVMANIPGYTNFPVVNLAKQISEVYKYPVGSSEISIRILQKANGLSYSHTGCVDIQFDETWRFGSSETQSSTYSYYPYAGNFNDPYFPVNDLSFNQQQVHFWYQPEIVEDNLFNTYYKNQFEELNDPSSRLLTCEMYLTPKDIYDFYFNHTIYLEIGGNGSYWRVNSIKNYDISGRSTCTVELIKIIRPLIPPIQPDNWIYNIDWTYDTNNGLTASNFEIQKNNTTIVNWNESKSGSFTASNLDTIFVLESSYLSHATYSSLRTLNIYDKDRFIYNGSNRDSFILSYTYSPNGDGTIKSSYNVSPPYRIDWGYTMSVDSGNFNIYQNNIQIVGATHTSSGYFTSSSIDTISGSLVSYYGPSSSSIITVLDGTNSNVYSNIGTTSSYTSMVYSPSSIGRIDATSTSTTYSVPNGISYYISYNSTNLIQNAFLIKVNTIPTIYDVQTVSGFHNGYIQPTVGSIISISDTVTHTLYTTTAYIGMIIKRNSVPVYYNAITGTYSTTILSVPNFIYNNAIWEIYVWINHIYI